MINLNEATAKEIVSFFSNEVNNLLFKPENIVKELKDSKHMKDLDLLWIKTLADCGYRTDARNEASAQAGKELAKIPFVKKKMELVCNEKMQEVAEKLKCDHRSLQQGFSELVFYHFLQSCKKKESETLLKVMGDSFYRLPLI